MKDRTNILDWDKLSTYGQDDLLQLAFVARETLVELESENHFSPLSIRIPVDLETLPMMLKVGIKSKYDLTNTGHPSISLHLDGFKAVRFSYFFISKGYRTKLRTSPFQKVSYPESGLPKGRLSARYYEPIHKISLLSSKPVRL
jgi:hypothetical protein